MDVKVLTNFVIAVSLLGIAVAASIDAAAVQAPSPASLGAASGKTQKSQYSFGRARQFNQKMDSLFRTGKDGDDTGKDVDTGKDTGDYTQQLDTYFKNHHSRRKSKTRERIQADTSSPSQCLAWGSWGPKTVLFGCGEQHRSRSCSTTHKLEVERKIACDDPKFEDQLKYFKEYFVSPLNELYGNSKQKETTRSRSGSSSQPLDLLFLVDRSQSMERLEFSRVRSAMAILVKNMELDISSGNGQVAMVTFGTDSNVEFKFDDYTSTLDVRKAILNVPQHRSGSSQLEQALRYCANNVFNSSKNFGARKGSRRVLLIVTDGKSTHNPQAAAEELKQQLDVEIFVVGFKRIDHNQLMAVSSHPKHHHVFYFETAQKVYKMVKQLKLNR